LHDRVTLTALEPKPVPGGWLRRVRVRNDGRSGDFTASIVGADGSAIPLSWRNGSAAAHRLATGRSEVVRVGVGRDDDQGVVRVRVSRGPKTVAEQSIAFAGQRGRDRIAEEAQRFGDQNNQALRGASWMAIPYFFDHVLALFDLVGTVREHLRDRPHPVGLTMACGDMFGEYGFFKQVGVAEVDASDISEGQRAKFYERYDGKIPVNYTIGDANEIQLEPERYDVVYLQHAYHHIEALEHVADQIAKSLKPGGIFALSDYVGANFLQRTPRQRDICSAIWRTLPERYRIGQSGRVIENLRIPSKENLPPYEAVRAEDIMGVLHERFEFRNYVAFGGLLMPLFNGFVHNYTDAPEDQEFIRLMWDLDQWLINNGAVEPNFMKAILVPR
jgi:SAM-dependent methyltransferase